MDLASFPSNSSSQPKRIPFYSVYEVLTGSGTPPASSCGHLKNVGRGCIVVALLNDIGRREYETAPNPARANESTLARAKCWKSDQPWGAEILELVEAAVGDAASGEARPKGPENHQDSQASSVEFDKSILG